MRKLYCVNCNKETNCELKEELKKEIIENVEIEYLEKKYICSECEEEVYDKELFNYNIHEANKKLREKSELITVEEIEEILTKYSIGKKPLALVLGLGEINIIRYLEGKNPTKDNSDLLKMALNSPDFFEICLINNQDKITEVAFKKSLGKAKQLELTNKHSKLYQVCLYILKKLDETTPMALQKILYFADGFSRVLLNNCLFNESVQAWKFGPVYSDIYYSFAYYKKDSIEYSEVLKDYEFNLDEIEKDFLDRIICSFGCYNGNILREMTHLTMPWIKAREGLDERDYSNRIIEEEDIYSYFEEVCKEYSIKSIEDIDNYSKELSKEAMEIIFKSRELSEV